VPPAHGAPSTARTLRKLYLTLLLRSPGLPSRQGSGQSATRLTYASLIAPVVIYALLGFLTALVLRGQPLFAVAVYLHATTFIFIGMFVAGSAGNVLFNSQEADTLLFRPIEPRALLWAKIAVLTQVSVCLAWAFNVGGVLVGVQAPDGDWRFVPAHALSTVLEGLFCTGCTVLVYQLCLKLCGRERLEGLMTTAQVVVSGTLVLASQVMPRLALPHGTHLPGAARYWMLLLPPAWFAGLDDVLASGGSPSTRALALLACLGTGAVLWAALGKLAADYTRGLQRLADVSRPGAASEPARGWVRRLLEMPPLSWWLRRPVERAAFLLCLAYLLRDRDIKLRVYPGIVTVVVIAFAALWQPQGDPHQALGGFALAFAGCVLGLVPLSALGFLRQSQQWQAGELFRVAPLTGPAELCDGARKAVLALLVLPLFALLAAAGWALGFGTRLLLLIPGLVALPVYSMIPCESGDTVPLSAPLSAAASMDGFLTTGAVLLGGLIVAGLAAAAQYFGWFWYFVAGESLLVLVSFIGLQRSLARAAWKPVG
jgi:hypothetical protein